MLLRSSISTTKRFFRRTFQNLKSFLNGGNYEKLPKTTTATPATTPSPFIFNPNSSANVSVHPHPPHDDHLDKFYADFTEKWDSEKGVNNALRKRSLKKKIASTLEVKQDRQSSLQGKYNHQHEHVGARKEDSSSSSNPRKFLVPRKLKELEMMDVSNIDHVLDIEEILHYYSLLTCPAYLEIIDKFFMEIYTELFASSTAAPMTPSSRRRLGIRDGPRILPELHRRKIG